MNTDEMFKRLEPPPGGAERFAQRLDEIAEQRPSPRARVLALGAAIAGVALVTAILLLRQSDEVTPELVAGRRPAVDVYNAPELDRLLGRSSQPAELMVMVDMEAANVTELETTNPKVRIYQIN